MVDLQNKTDVSLKILKKSFIYIATAVMLLWCGCNALAAGELLYQEDLSSYTNGASADGKVGWGVYYGGAGINATTDPLIFEDGAIKFTKSNLKATDARVFKNLPPVQKSGKVVYEFNIKYPKSFSPYYSYRFLKLSVVDINGTPLFPGEFSNDGATLGVVNSPTTGDWQNYKYIIDYDKKVYNIMVDGQYLSKDSSYDFAIPAAFLTGGDVKAFEFQLAVINADNTANSYTIYEKGFKIYNAVAPQMVSTSIVDITKAPVNSAITLTFNTELDVSTFTKENIGFSTLNGESIEYTLESVLVQGIKKAVKITPLYPLNYSTPYNIIVKKDIKSAVGSKMVSDETIAFTTDTPLFEVTNFTPQLAGGVFSATLDIKNRLAETKNAYIISSLYDGDNVSKMIYTKKEVVGNGTGAVNVSITDPNAASPSAEIYFWDGIGNDTVQAMRTPYYFQTPSTITPASTIFNQLPAIDVSLNIDTEELVVSGQSNIKYSNQPITIRILNPNKTLDDVLQADENSLNTVFNRVAQTTTDNNGRFTWKYKVKGGNGLYKVMVCMPLQSNSFIKTFSFVSAQSRMQALSALNNASSSTIEDVVKNNMELLNFDNTIFNTLTDKSFVYLCLLNKNFSNLNSALAEFNKAVTIQAIKEKQNEADAITLMNANHALLGIDTKSTYNRFVNVMNSNQKTALIIGLKGVSYANSDEFIDKFNSLVVIKSVEMVAIWSEIEGILKNSNDLLGWNFDKYDALNTNTQKPVVMKSLLGISYPNLNALKIKFDASVISAGNITSGSVGQTGGSGKGSGGGVYAWTGGAPVIADPIINDDSNQQELNIADVFTDVADITWAIPSISKLNELGIVNGKGNKTFVPNDFVTREQFIKMIIAGLKLSADGASNKFTDVKVDDWYYPFISSAYEKKIVNGLEDGSFGVGTEITRQEMAVMVYRAAIVAGFIFDEDIRIKPFTDENTIAEYALQPIKILRENDIIGGMGNNVFAPTQNVTRAQAAKIIYTLMGFGKLY